MTTLDPRAVKAALDAYGIDVVVDGLEAAIAAYLAATQPQAGEAVAWRYKLYVADVDWTVSTTKPKGAIVEPLYTSPQPANPVQVTDASEGRYRKKPVVIEAFQMTKERRMDNSDWPNWLHKAWNGTRNEAGTLQRVDMDAPLPDYLQIVTLEGLHLVSWGDWIIQGVKGELYPCKPDIFDATYEPALTAAIGTGGQAVGDSLWVPAKPEHKKIGWVYDFDQIERIARSAESATGYDATMEVVMFVMAEADRRHKSALSQPHPADERVVEALRAARDVVDACACQDVPTIEWARGVRDKIDTALSGSGAGWRAECATEGCHKPATVLFERGGVGSYYCHDCYMRVQAIPTPPQTGREG